MMTGKKLYSKNTLAGFRKCFTRINSIRVDWDYVNFVRYNVKFFHFFTYMNRVISHKSYIFTFHTCDINVLLLLAFRSKATHKDTINSTCCFDLYKNDTKILHIFRKWLPSFYNVHNKMCRLLHDLLNYHNNHDSKELII